VRQVQRHVGVQRITLEVSGLEQLRTTKFEEGVTGRGRRTLAQVLHENLLTSEKILGRPTIAHGNLTDHLVKPATSQGKTVVGTGRELNGQEHVRHTLVGGDDESGRASTLCRESLEETSILYSWDSLFLQSLRAVVIDIHYLTESHFILEGCIARQRHLIMRLVKINPEQRI
jgi:hypothetical protein